MSRAIRIGVPALSVILLLGGPSWAAVILDDDFTGSAVDTGLWNIQKQDVDTVETDGTTNLHVVNTDAGGFWGNGAGIYHKGATPQTPLFDRPTNAGEYYEVYFYGVQLPDAQVRCAWGLSSIYDFQTDFGMPDGDGNYERMSYGWWVRPDDSYNGNWVRTKTVNAHSAATAGAGEQLWAFGEVRDFKILVTPDDVEWYLRVQPSTSWILVRDPLDTNNLVTYNGAEPGGRSTFGLYVHTSAAAADGPVSWVDADILMDRIVVNYVPEPASVGLLAVGGLSLLRRRR
jgi:hypothetical protein